MQKAKQKRKQRSGVEKSRTLDRKPLSTFTLGLGLSLFLNAAASAQDQRDEEIFGSPTPPQPESSPQPPSVSQSSPQNEGRTQGLGDTLQVGGRLEVRGATGQLEQQPFPEASYSQLKTADIYFDTRPNKDLRVFLRTRLEERDATVTTPGTAGGPPSSQRVNSLTTAIDELWFKWDLEDRLFFTYGKQHLKWGSGRLWNPTDFTAREVRDPFALFDRRLGQELLKIHFPQEKEGHNYYAVFQFDDASRNDDISLALRGEFSVGSSAELAISAQTGRARPQRIGLDLSSALGPFDVNVEAAGSKRNQRDFFTGGIDVETRQLPGVEKREDRWLGQALGGIRQSYQYSEEDNFTWGVEYLWNELGYEEADLELYSLALGQSQPLYAGRRYVGAFFLLPNPGSWNETSFYLNAIQNLSDRSATLRLTATWELVDAATIEAYVSRCFGDTGELCLKLPPAYKELAELPGVSPEVKSAVALLPTRQTRVTAGTAVTIVF